MICQQVFTVSSKTANHLANTYALEYNLFSFSRSQTLLSIHPSCSGGPDAYIMADGGWRSDKVLKSVYRHAMDDRKKEMSDIANSHFSQLCNTKKIKHRISAMFYSSERGT